MSEGANLCLLEPQLLLGLVSSISAGIVKINLDNASQPTATSQRGRRYGLGEVGEFILIEGESSHILGRIIETRLPESERLSVDPSQSKRDAIHPIGMVMLLGTFDVLEDKIRPGIQQYPRLGARAYSAQHEFLAKLPSYLDSKPNTPAVTLDLGAIKSASNTQVKITPERIFGRHCAILGTTGGGKSYTVARLLGECIKHNAKVILLDATGEYKSFNQAGAQSATIMGGAIENNLVGPLNECCIPATELNESDLLSLFQPAARSQAPIFREALKSLRLLHIHPTLGEDGVLKKSLREKRPIATALRKHANYVNDPKSPFNISNLAQQISEECVFETDRNQVANQPVTWGGRDNNAYSFVQSLLVRINWITRSESFSSLFPMIQGPSLMDIISSFLGSQSDYLLRINLEKLSFENNAREIIANIIGRWLLNKARHGHFLGTPTIIILDEAHQFLNKSVGADDTSVKLDAFELIAKEGRKYGLNICLATQRPRDLPEGVLSQMGTLIVHRLTNHQDREIVERACGEIDRSASAFLPNLQPGEAALIGVDFPIPMTIQMKRPEFPPQSTGPDYQKSWLRALPTNPSTSAN